MKPCLDATAGYRMMWPTKQMEGWVYLDKRPEVKPDLVAMWSNLPFRDNVFEVIMFDPPHLIDRGGMGKIIQKMREKYTTWSRRKDVAPTIFKAAKEFSRVGNILILKWYDDKVSLWQLYSVFRGLWDEISRVVRPSRSGLGKKDTFFITFKRHDRFETILGTMEKLPT